MEMAIRHLARDWDEYAKIYELKQSSDADLNLNVILPALTDLVPKRLTDLRILDHCCGRGALTKILLERGAEVTAVDFSKELIRQAKKDIGNHPNMTFAVLDCLEVADCMNRPVAVIFRARATSIQRVQRTNAADT
jgi:2-polyprenyl-3-methyl-5-hydroxy-6-metoxy-1,4-benzoquinol methylase